MVTTINPNWHGTLEFLAGMLNEDKATELIEELAKDYLEIKKQCGSDLWKYSSDNDFIIECVGENKKLVYGKSNHLDEIINEYLSTMDSWIIDMEDFCKLSSKSMVTVLTSILNSDVPIKKKTEFLIDFSEFFNCYHKVYTFSYQEGSLNYGAVETIVNFIEFYEKNGTVECFTELLDSYKRRGNVIEGIADFTKFYKEEGELIPINLWPHARYIHELGKGIKKTPEIVSLLKKSFYSKTSSNSSVDIYNHVKRFYLALILGNSINPDDLTDILKSESLLKMDDHYQIRLSYIKEIVAKINESLETKLN